MKLERAVLIAARYGCHDRHHSLNKSGILQMQSLAFAVCRVANKRGLKIEILCSDEPCALQGADIVANCLTIPTNRVICREGLRIDNFHKGDLEEAKELVSLLLKDGTLVLIITNVAAAHVIARYFAPQFSANVRMSEVPHGKGIMVAKKGVSVIPRQQ